MKYTDKEIEDAKNKLEKELAMIIDEGSVELKNNYEIRLAQFSFTIDGAKWTILFFDDFFDLSMEPTGADQINDIKKSFGFGKDGAE